MSGLLSVAPVAVVVASAYAVGARGRHPQPLPGALATFMSMLGKNTQPPEVLVWGWAAASFVTILGKNTQTQAHTGAAETFASMCGKNTAGTAILWWGASQSFVGISDKTTGTAILWCGAVLLPKSFLC